MAILEQQVEDPSTLGVFDSIADAVGNTPLVRLNAVTDGIAATVYAKLEFLNPGGSVKDRAALAMIRAAEESGELGPGGTVVEGTSGNTGVGLSLIAAARGGYRSVVVVPDKTSAEKIALLRAHGATVHVTPGGRPSHHPDFVRNVAARLASETPPVPGSPGSTTIPPTRARIAPRRARRSGARPVAALPISSPVSERAVPSQARVSTCPRYPEARSRSSAPTPRPPSTAAVTDAPGTSKRSVTSCIRRPWWTSGRTRTGRTSSIGSSESRTPRP